jgi:UDP-N-acetylmuramate dehydrogenase
MATVRDFLEKINIKAMIEYDAPMAAHTSFAIGGPADALVRPRDPESAAALLAAARGEGIPVFVLGAGANILVGDRGIRGIVLDTSLLAGLRDGNGSGSTSPDDGTAVLVAGAGLSMDALCLEALARGQGGLEDFAGMPGSVGGSVFMNARCYEREVAEVLVWAEALMGDGRVERWFPGPEDWGYKRSPFMPGGRAEGGLVLGAAFRTAPDDPARLAAVMRARRADREAKGHYRMPSAGSGFKNDRSLGRPSGKILDELGLRGRRIGGAMVSPWHANIFVNAGGATASDMLALVELASGEAMRALGARLVPEVIFVGEF